MKENENVLGAQKAPVIKQFLKKKWAGLGLWYRLCTFSLGMSIPMFVVGGFVRNEFLVSAIFFAVMLGAFISVGKMLKEIYLIDGAQKYMAAHYTDFGQVERTRKSVVCLGKTLSIVGNWFGSFVTSLLISIGDSGQIMNRTFVEKFANNIVETISISLLTGWLGFSFVLICQLVSMGKAKKMDKVLEAEEAIIEEAMCKTVRVPDGYRPKTVPGAVGMKIGYAVVGLGVVGNLVMVQPLLPEIESKQEQLVKNDEDNEDEIEDKVQEETYFTQEGYIEESENEMEEVDDYNPNGYGFSIGQDCLNVYLDYVKYAEDDYETAEKKNGGFYEEHRLAYFSIAGMAGDEPFLLLSSTTGNGCGDETYFVTYTPYDYSGEGIEQIHMQGDFEFGLSCDYYSMRQSDVVNTIYVWASNPKTGSRFIHREDTLYVIDYDDSSQDEWDYSGDEVYCNEKGTIRCSTNYNTPAYFEEKLASGELMEIKWFSINQIEEAREYYQQYVREEVYDGPVETENRKDYFNDNTVLKYVEYISEGVFEVVEEDDGDIAYRFSCLTDEAADAISYKGLENALTFQGYSDSQSVNFYFFENTDGSWTCVKMRSYHDKYGQIYTYNYETSENSIINWYSTNSGEVFDTVEEVIQDIKTRQ